MGNAPTPLVLSPEEHRLIIALRSMPESPLRDRVQRLVADLVAFARNPRCPELQADGAPCANPEADCDQCKVVLAMLEAMGKRLPRERAE